MVSGSATGRVGVFNKEFIPKTRRDGGAELQSLVSVPNIPGVNPKSLYSAYDVIAYVLMITSSMSYGTRGFNDTFTRTLQ